MQLFRSDPKRNGNFGHFPLFFVGGYWLVMRVSRKDKFVIKVWLLQKSSKLPKTGCCYFPLVLKNIRNIYPCMRYFVWETWWPSGWHVGFPGQDTCVWDVARSMCCVLGQSTLLSLCLFPPPPPQEHEWVPANCQRRLTKYWLGGLGRGGSDNMPPWTSFP